MSLLESVKNNQDKIAFYALCGAMVLAFVPALIPDALADDFSTIKPSEFKDASLALIPISVATYLFFSSLRTS